MSEIQDERYAWMRNPFLRREPGDFTPFYAIIAICTLLGFFLFALNVAFCCSRYRGYWRDVNTGNRWIIPIWTRIHNQPPLDLTELDEAWVPQPEEFAYPDNYSDYEQPQVTQRSQHEEFVELVKQHKAFQKKESDL